MYKTYPSVNFLKYFSIKLNVSEKQLLLQLKIGYEETLWEELKCLLLVFQKAYQNKSEI